MTSDGESTPYSNSGRMTRSSSTASYISIAYQSLHLSTSRDPGAPKKPLSPYFLYFQDERLKVKAMFPNYTVTEEAKEVGRRWAVIDPVLKQVYQQRYQDAFQNYKRMMEGRGNHAT